MENLQENSSSEQLTSSKAPMPLIISIIVIVIIIVVAWQYTGEKPLPPPVAEKAVIKKEVETPKEVIEPEPEIIEPVEIVTEPEIIENPLPELAKSDAWLQKKLPTLTWRKELLNLVIDDDMIRRFVVFTDNFAQGTIAYEHSPFVLPSTSFSVTEQERDSNSNSAPTAWQWNEKATRRFSLYVDLLRSFDSETLIQWYMEVKPLIDEAYAELGYPDEDFTETLQDAITRVLDMELPKASMSLVRPSVMYQFQSPELEGLDETDKLLLRLGKENLLIIKSVLLELNEKLAQEKNGVK